jgi:hypothetical protein
VGLRERYVEAVQAAQHRRGQDELTPSVLAAACVAVLPIDGAGISMSQRQLRVPLGWSGSEAATAERTQTTLGEGPCLTAAAASAALVVDADALVDRWPVYGVELTRRTPFRSVASIPLGTPGQPVFGALDLYASRPDLSTVLILDEAVDAVGGPIAGFLSGMLDEVYEYEVEPPSWWDQGPAVDRADVWTAVGMLIAANEFDDVDDTSALARLRGFAFRHDLTLDETADRLLNRELTPRSVLH